MPSYRERIRSLPSPSSFVRRWWSSFWVLLILFGLCGLTTAILLLVDQDKYFIEGVVMAYITLLLLFLLIINYWTTFSYIPQCFRNKSTMIMVVGLLIIPLFGTGIQTIGEHEKNDIAYKFGFIFYGIGLTIALLGGYAKIKGCN